MKTPISEKRSCQSRPGPEVGTRRSWPSGESLGRTPAGWKANILRHGIPYSDVIQVFGGGIIEAKDRPLFCAHCDSELIPEYQRLWNAHAPTDDLVAVLEKRRGKIVEATWPNGRRQWQCSYCGRAAKVKKERR